MKVPEFDIHAPTYSEALTSALGAMGGGEATFFAIQKADVLKRRLAGRMPRKILDFGCGTGSLTLQLDALWPNAVLHGFDPSSKSIDTIDPRLRNKGRFVASEGNLDADYDLIVMAGVMHHIAPEQRHETLVRLRDRLCQGGRLAVFEHNPANPMTRRVVERCVFDEGVVLLSPGEMGGLARTAGFQRVTTTYTLFFPPALSILQPIEAALGWCPLGAQFLTEGYRSDD